MRCLILVMLSLNIVTGCVTARTQEIARENQGNFDWGAFMRQTNSAFGPGTPIYHRDQEQTCTVQVLNDYSGVPKYRQVCE